MPFVKGKSGNPGGRPKDTAQIKELAQKLCPEAIAKLAEWMRSDNPKASVAACTALLDRGYGKPNQSHEVSASGGGAFFVSLVVKDKAEDQ